jgi:hypothetical protein
MDKMYGKKKLANNFFKLNALGKRKQNGSLNHVPPRNRFHKEKENNFLGEKERNFFRGKGTKLLWKAT